MTEVSVTHWSNPESLRAPDSGAALWWLGQAGFLLEIAGQRIVIDPYLSDSLAEKYRGKRFPHIRMMPAPVAPEDLTGIDWILCTHGHTDHLDPGTLPGLLAANLKARVVVPTSQRALAVERGVPEARLLTVDAGERLELNGIDLVATPAAHEALEKDADGRHKFLGYALRSGEITIWHSGDTIPFPGLVESVAPLDIDLALLPVNGRDAIRAGNGVPGNLTLEEALALTDRIGARAMIGHHLDLFEFNTLDRTEGEKRIAAAKPAQDVCLAEAETRYAIASRAAKRPVTRVLAVCRGNICRSPLAEAILRDVLPAEQFEVDSAAIKDWHIGKAPDARSIAVASERGLDIAAQRVRQVQTEDFAEFDFILGMDGTNMAALESMRPQGSRAKLLMLGNCPEAGEDCEISDPYDGDAEDFRNCFDHISVSVQSFRAKFL